MAVVNMQSLFRPRTHENPWMRAICVDLGKEDEKLVKTNIQSMFSMTHFSCSSRFEAYVMNTFSIIIYPMNFHNFLCLVYEFNKRSDSTFM